MRLMSTGAPKYRMRVLSAIKLVGLPKPSITIYETFVVSWFCGKLLVQIIESLDHPSHFDCRIFVYLKPLSSIEINLDALDGPARLVEFLDAVAVWLVI